MIWVDYVIIAIIVLSALMSLMRGLIREVLSLAAWVLAFWVSLNYVHVLAGRLGGLIPLPSARQAGAFLILLVATLLIMGVVNFFVGRIIAMTGLTGTDKMLGIFFGIARGVLIIAVLVFLAKLTPLPQDPWWSESLLIRHFEPITLWLKDLLPEDAAGYFQFLEDKSPPQPPSKPLPSS
jgi:membrane protein required for colicin V production